jgi:hypothetical protein
MTLFGHQIRYSWAVLEAHTHPLDFGADRPAQAKLVEQYSKVVMQIVVSLALLTISLIILMRPNTAEDLRRTAAGFLGTIVGYWLR